MSTFLFRNIVPLSIYHRQGWESDIDKFGRLFTDNVAIIVRVVCSWFTRRLITQTRHGRATLSYRAFISEDISWSSSHATEANRTTERERQRPGVARGGSGRRKKLLVLGVTHYGHNARRYLNCNAFRYAQPFRRLICIWRKRRNEQKNITRTHNAYSGKELKGVPRSARVTIVYRRHPLVTATYRLATRGGLAHCCFISLSWFWRFVLVNWRTRLNVLPIISRMFLLDRRLNHNAINRCF